MRKINSPNFKRFSFFLTIIVLMFLQTACQSFIKVQKSFENRSLSQSPPNQNNKKKLAEEFDLKSASGAARREIYGLLSAKDFDAIEKTANEARKNKERLVGGYWKIDSLYEALTNIYADYPGQEITEEMWKNRIEVLKKWKENMPESITARVALARAYIAYGWFARGSGYMNTVSRENRALLNERLDLAEEELIEAEKLDLKCPRWYVEMLYIGMAKGVPVNDFNLLYEEAIKFEPNYLQFYLTKSEYLTPKWSGEKGDWEKFVSELPGKLATLETDEDDLIYFVVVANKINEQSLQINFAMLAKERIKKGFAEMDKKYKVDNLRLNQFAFTAILTGEYASANAVFERIGDDWNKTVWNKQTFIAMKKVAAQNGDFAQYKNAPLN